MTHLGRVLSTCPFGFNHNNDSVDSFNQAYRSGASCTDASTHLNVTRAMFHTHVGILKSTLH